MEGNVNYHYVSICHKGKKTVYLSVQSLVLLLLSTPAESPVQQLRNTPGHKDSGFSGSLFFGTQVKHMLPQTCYSICSSSRAERLIPHCTCIKGGTVEIPGGDMLTEDEDAFCWIDRGHAVCDCQFCLENALALKMRYQEMNHRTQIKQ